MKSNNRIVENRYKQTRLDVRPCRQERKKQRRDDQ